MIIKIMDINIFKKHNNNNFKIIRINNILFKTFFSNTLEGKFLIHSYKFWTNFDLILNYS